MSTYLMDAWRDAFVLELRLRDVPGPAIGDALAEVEAHCAQSGETPQQAFGDPQTYAAAIADVLPHVAPDRSFPWWRAGLLAFGTASGVNLILAGIAGTANGSDHGWISVGSVVATLTGSVAVGVVTANLEPLLRHRRPYRLAAALGVALLSAVWPTLLWPGQLTGASPAWLVPLVGVAVLALTWLPNWAVLRREARDRIVDPRTGLQPFRTPWWVNALALAFPAALFLLAAATVVLQPR